MRPRHRSDEPDPIGRATSTDPWPTRPTFVVRSRRPGGSGSRPLRSLDLAATSSARVACAGRQRLLPFDPNAVVQALLREEYVTGGPPRRWRDSFLGGRAGRAEEAANGRPPPVGASAGARGVSTLADRASLHDLCGCVLRLVEDVNGSPLCLGWRLAPRPVPLVQSTRARRQRKVGYEPVETLRGPRRRERGEFAPPGT